MTEPGDRYEVCLSNRARRYDATVQTAGDDRLRIEATGCDAGGVVTATLTAEVPAGDLENNARLLVTAGGLRRGADPFPVVTVRGSGSALSGVVADRRPATVAEQRSRHPNAYRPWTEEDDRRLSERFGAGVPIDDLVQEFGRKRGAITSRLAKLGLAR